jgi:hypothetical protein
MRDFARCPRHIRSSNERSIAARLASSVGSIVRYNTVLGLLATFAIFTAFVIPASAAEPSNEAMHSLDEQVQEIKSDVLAIAAELDNLEEKLLYPSDTQVALFVALEEGDSLELDSVQISIDGKLATHHIYSFKEIEALRKGGVQRIYTGNVGTGQHQLDVSIAGRTSGGRDVDDTQRFAFRKDVEPKLVGITLGSGATGDVKIGVGDW